MTPGAWWRRTRGSGCRRWPRRRPRRRRVRRGGTPPASTQGSGPGRRPAAPPGRARRSRGVAARPAAYAPGCCADTPSGSVSAVEPPVAVRRATALATVVPRSAGAWWRSARRPAGDLPASRLSARSAGELAVDELLPAVNTAVRRVPDVATLQASVEEAADVGAALGPLDPEQLHRPPVALTDPD